MRLSIIKPEIRVVGFDDCAFTFGQKETIVIGTIFRGGDYLDGLISTKIKVDGLDSTAKLAECINSSRHKDQIRIIMLNGITFGGFNIVDIHELHKKTSMPVIAVVGHKPDLKSIKLALEKFKDFRERFSLIEKAGKIRKINIEAQHRKNTIYYQQSGLDTKTAEKVIKATSTRSTIPEPLRIADIICKGLSPVFYEK